RQTPEGEDSDDDAGKRSARTITKCGVEGVRRVAFASGSVAGYAGLRAPVTDAARDGGRFGEANEGGAARIDQVAGVSRGGESPDNATRSSPVVGDHLHPRA